MLRANREVAQLPWYTEPSKTMARRSYPSASAGPTATLPQGSTTLPATARERNKTTHGPCLSPAVPEPDLLVIVATDDDVVPAHHVITVGKYIDGSGT